MLQVRKCSLRRLPASSQDVSAPTPVTSPALGTSLMWSRSRASSCSTCLSRVRLARPSSNSTMKRPGTPANGPTPTAPCECCPALPRPRACHPSGARRTRDGAANGSGCRQGSAPIPPTPRAGVRTSQEPRSRARHRQGRERCPGWRSIVRRGRWEGARGCSRAQDVNVCVGRLERSE